MNDTNMLDAIGYYIVDTDDGHDHGGIDSFHADFNDGAGETTGDGGSRPAPKKWGAALIAALFFIG